MALIIILLLLQLSLASDKIASSSEPVLRLNLTLENDDKTTKDVVIELPKSDLDKLITSLQHANQVTSVEIPCKRRNVGD